MFTQIKGNIEFVDSLEKLSESECNELRNMFPGISEDYLDFLSQVGHGNLGDIQLYEGPVSPSSIYGKTSAEVLDGLVVFGDDFQGYCFAFDSKDFFVSLSLALQEKLIELLKAPLLSYLRDIFNMLRKSLNLLYAMTK